MDRENNATAEKRRLRKVRSATLALLFLTIECQQQRKVPDDPRAPAEDAAPPAKPALKKEKSSGKKPEAAIPETCGNGQLDADESCDDGNRQGGDGCSPRCRKEAVGFLSAHVVDSGGHVHSPPGDSIGELGIGPVVRFEKFVAMLEGEPLRLAKSLSSVRTVPAEFSGQVEHFAGMATTYVVALKNGEVWEVNAHLDPKTACKDRGLEQPGVLAADGQRWCRWPRRAKRVIDLGVYNIVEEGGEVYTMGRTIHREVVPPATAAPEYGGTSCALLETGEVACWGMNSYGQVGYMSREVPEAGEDPGYFVADDPPKTFLKFPTPVKKLEVGHATFALTEGGELWCWGNCYDLPFADTGDPQPYWHRMVTGDPPLLGNWKAVGESTMPSAPLKLPEGCVPKDFRSSCVICEDGCLKCWHDKKSLEKTECVTY